MIRDLVADVIELTRGLVDSGKLELRNSVPEGMTVLGDPGRIIQVNLGGRLGGWVLGLRGTST